MDDQRRETTMAAAKNGSRPKAKVPASQEVRIQQLEDDAKLQAWLYAELVYSVRVALTQMALANPQVQQALAAQMVQQGGMQ